MTHYAKEIDYVFTPHSSKFIIAVDIGGTLAKVVYSSHSKNSLRFKTIETEKIDQFIQLLHKIIRKYNNNDYENTRLVATGGGAFKFKSLLDKEFNQLKDPIVQLDEMACLINGLDFFIHTISDEVFTYSETEGQLLRGINVTNDSTYPYMLVNIGSGVSILKVNGPNEFERVGGSSLGGGTLWGLLSLITGAKSYDQMLQWAQDGDNTNVDMLVGDIYGTDYGKIGLKASSIASSFGKVFQGERSERTGERSERTGERSGTATSSSNSSDTSDTDSERRDSIENGIIEDGNNGSGAPMGPHEFNNEDICKSLLYAVSNNIGQIAYLQAHIHNIQNIYFGGSYIRGHLTTMNTLSYAINFWSKGTKQAFFLKHEGYLGAMGAFLQLERQSMTPPP
ncbi:similar to Saccharomyces cerevisiae YDR531W CAB1 Pantothenate kinase (ATP:D-pantothenate 4'-phosphotransferase, EC [Maudiozyma barnettii]|uniref:Similar to Saccharomyces cerevisiae YDR531W CAB1 Pantothenate kinase (ATP:D-pantothenate 4'-phosphotransferase, EC) n=1 Tax=Maudiozyma barnettii TaxID=61262 RepID=A0A8H2ZKI4_9SACH|nr:similar to Saccharomyces cerevisiae YDR531W CAB1 Pantothenate kinase (ATP:D-pantothenate 4'-phosphotransferase, EC [Kazachstania barnettii]CAB4255217.1 similar to Saccharomyces cerevisiae YDR531W CAB1 Pantothenate kinase (ATP:D-pantothenate 4'-phosphotransferase, EC [Kazachstania barnettii]CAD1783625.1 similar to Saccharomyces cerevisiae YDR531W CAB1 Pantothenate kinase (ATP:D-pantothenate 4'-phosphotransferase, EC [Kazachstania barnettii]